MKIVSPAPAWIGLLSIAGVAAAAYGIARWYTRSIDAPLQLDADDFSLQPLSGGDDAVHP